MHQQPVLKRMGLFYNQSYPIAEKIYKYGFYLPSGIALKNNEIKQVVKNLNEIIYKI
jgi:perosamine synthetase